MQFGPHMKSKRRMSTHVGKIHLPRSLNRLELSKETVYHTCPKKTLLAISLVACYIRDDSEKLVILEDFRPPQNHRGVIDFGQHQTRLLAFLFWLYSVASIPTGTVFTGGFVLRVVIPTWTEWRR